MPYVWSYGMGAESTAGILRMLTDPAARPDTIAPDLSNLVIVIAQTGDEWSTTGRLVQHYILPLFRKYNVRLVELARRGQTKKDGVAVLQDTRQPYRLHLDGVYKLSRENRVTGTMPQLGGVRKCSVDCTKSVLSNDGESICDREGLVHVRSTKAAHGRSGGPPPGRRRDGSEGNASPVRGRGRRGCRGRACDSLPARFGVE
jgi:hypothetical protein